MHFSHYSTARPPRQHIFEKRARPREREVDSRRPAVHTCRVETFRVARVGLHFFEEPCISGSGGSGTVFFSGCDMRCIFCQNRVISRGGAGVTVTGDDLLRLMLHLEKQGAENINLVTPTPWAKRLIPVLKEFKTRSKLPVVWNSNGCDDPAVVREAGEAVDIWLPDLKYSDDALGREYSVAENCFSRSVAAISAMRALRGRDVFDERGMMREGVIVRHLVLPGAIENTKGVLRAIADIDREMYVSLMGQYFPTPAVADHPVLSRRLTEEEYDEATEEFFRAGLTNGFAQELSSATEEYVPDFDPEPLRELVGRLRAEG